MQWTMHLSFAVPTFLVPLESCRRIIHRHLIFTAVDLVFEQINEHKYDGIHTFEMSLVTAT